MNYYHRIIVSILAVLCMSCEKDTLDMQEISRGEHMVPAKGGTYYLTSGNKDNWWAVEITADDESGQTPRTIFSNKGAADSRFPASGIKDSWFRIRQDSDKRILCFIDENKTRKERTVTITMECWDEFYTFQLKQQGK